MKRMRLLKEIPKINEDGPSLMFQEIAAYAPPYGMIVCYRFDENHGGRYLPVKGSGWVFFIDSRRKDGRHEVPALAARGRGYPADWAGHAG